MEINDDGITKRIEILEMHIEEDTSKSIHSKETTLLDFNRAGVPLIEIVTKPCIHTAKEATLYLEKLRELLLYANVSDCKIEEGSMRCDANISISKTDTLGTKVEVKNIGSITNVGLAIEYEGKRQAEILDAGEKLQEETRRYDAKLDKTILMRVKETGNDYRYFPEPDIPKVILDDEWIDDIRKTIPMLPNELRSMYKNLGINDVAINSLILNRELNIALNNLIDMNVNPVLAANILTGDILSYLNKNYITFNETKVSLENMKDIVRLLESGKISSKIGKEIISELLVSGGNVDSIIETKGLKQINNTDEIRNIIHNIIKNNPKAVEDYKNGLDRSIKYLMGQIMKETKGHANPKMANDMLIEELNKE